MRKSQHTLKENPQVFSEWDYTKNFGIEPDCIPLYSNKKYYWICKEGHPSYLATVNHRTTRGDGCPVCSNHQILKGINDFESLHPELMTEWNFEKNQGEQLLPDSFSEKSSFSVWWICQKCGGTWKASINNRVVKHSGCPFCANLKVKQGYNDLMTVYPGIAEEWDYEKNGPLAPSDIVAHSTKRIWWKCKSCGGTWQSSAMNRVKRNCPYCNKHTILIGYNDLQSQLPALIEEWDFEKNSILPSQVFKGSEKKVWWVCSLGHSWQARINSRARGRGCPYCSNKKVLAGFNDLASKNPELLYEWDYQKNTSLKPTEITSGSNKKVWWHCEKCEFEWAATISSRVAGRHCPKCAAEHSKTERLRSMAAKNPLFSQFPSLEKEWDYEKNQSVDISLIPASSNRKVWWKCEYGHSYNMSIHLRTRQKESAGCPYCHNQRVIVGVNDLETIYPELAKEWDYELNNPLLPSMVFSHSSKKVWWKCPICNQSWNAKVNNRAHGRGCPNCNPNGTSFYEQVLFYYLKQCFPDAINRYRISDYELDIYIDSYNVAVEFDGAFFHSGKAALVREAKKNVFCKSTGIRLIRIREHPLGPSVGAENLLCDCSTWGKLEQVCQSTITLIDDSKIVDTAIDRDYHSIVEFGRMQKKARAFYLEKPDLLKEWDYEKNGLNLPDYYSKGSNTKVWWRCKKGHSWMASIANRCHGTGCPKCNKSSPKPVEMLSNETGEILQAFPSASAAQKRTGIASQNIIKVCQGKRSSAGGFKWQYPK